MKLLQVLFQFSVVGFCACFFENVLGSGSCNKTNDSATEQQARTFLS